MPCKYLKTRFTATQCSFPGLDINLLNTPTACAMSGLVQTIAYIKLPTTLAYGTRDILSSSSCVLGHCLADNLTPTGTGTFMGLLSCILNLWSIVSTYFLWFNHSFLFA